VAWYLHTGEDPGNLQIDHIDRNRSNNKFSNLCLANSTEDNLNNDTNKSKTGIKGVYVSASGFYAQISLKGKNYHLGHTKTIEQAIKLREDAIQKHYNTSLIPDYNSEQPRDA
jgi:hypothetical protein